ncbi:hypothetical protein Tco_0287767, partial [Tanacetum coccineum]
YDLDECGKDWEEREWMNKMFSNDGEGSGRKDMLSYYQRQKEKRNPSEPIADDVAMQKARKKQYNLNYRNKQSEIRKRHIAANGEGSSQPRTGLSNMNVMNRISLGTLENHHTNSSTASEDLNSSQGWNKENIVTGSRLVAMGYHKMWVHVDGSGRREDGSGGVGVGEEDVVA